MANIKPQITDFYLTTREKDILYILWNSNKGLIASEIVKLGDNTLTINTVQAVLKKLLKRELIQIDQFVYSGTVLSRSYIPTLSEEEFMVNMVTNEVFAYLKRFDISPRQFFKNFICNNIESLSNEDMQLITSIIQNSPQ